MVVYLVRNAFTPAQSLPYHKLLIMLSKGGPVRMIGIRKSPRGGTTPAGVQPSGPTRLRRVQIPRRACCEQPGYETNRDVSWGGSSSGVPCRVSPLAKTRRIRGGC